MTITIRNLKRSPTGRESIRERDYESHDITFGRDVSCDVPLQGLSVALNHAKLSYDDAGRVFLDVNSDQRVSVNNRICTGRVGPLTAGTIIKIGNFALTLEEPSDKAALVALLEELDGDTKTTIKFDEDKVFGLRGALPSKRWMAWLFVVSVLCLWVFLPLHIHQNPKGKVAENSPIQTDMLWNSGPISLMHSNLKNDCKSCHINGWEAVTDITCLDCHTKLQDHAPASDLRASRPEATGFEAMLGSVSEAFGRPVDRCASCHVEHNGSAHIMPDSKALCRDCHANFDQASPDAAFLKVSDFGTDHPQFRPIIITDPTTVPPVTQRVSLDDNPKGFSGLKFPHDVHLSTTGAVAKMASTLDVKYGFSDGVGCADCHREDVSGVLYEPVSMTQDCAMCHSIVFEDDDGFPRTLRHGVPKEVIASMRDFYDAKALGNIRDAEMNSTTRRRPGRAATFKSLNHKALAFKQSKQRTIAKVEAIFSEGGACYDCHLIDRPDDVSTMDFKVRPINISDAFYSKSIFNHKAHEIKDLTCQSCHTAERSKTSNDTLLPKIQICQDCHVDEESYREGAEPKYGRLPTNCLTCHSFHNGQHGQKSIESERLDE